MLIRRVFCAVIVSFSLFLFSSFSVNLDSFTKTKDIIIIIPNPQLAGNPKALQLQVVSRRFIRITATPQKELPVTKSLIAIHTTNPNIKWKVVSGKESVMFKPSAIVLKGAGIVDKKRSGQPTVFDGSTYHFIRF